MSRHEDDLNAALRRLAEARPREAPQHVEAALRDAFRRQRGASRFRGGIVVAIAAGAAAASIAIFMWMAPQAAGPPERVAAWTVPLPIAGARESGSRGVREPGHHRVRATLHKPTRRPATDQVAATTTEFVPLPYGDDALVGENTTIVRMELPRSALRLAGFSVA